ncbi:uncharacterized protein LOC133298186 [Gastrolobium bilobum]|uniref:uncharacterized protein LOC133298186 n=1 Tax=Gastrolobium bilobum TaxID=150636 RepID=UPI002AB180AB|nr:uncharacterized protein LOC133298186 [Gastrolobium bilobum]
MPWCINGRMVPSHRLNRGGINLELMSKSNICGVEIAANLQTRTQGSLAGNTDVPSTTSPKVAPISPSEQIKVVTLRSGKATAQPTVQPKEKEQNEASEAAPKAQQQSPVIDEQNPEPEKEANSQPISPTQSRQILTKIPFPQRTKKQQEDKHFVKFLDILKQLHINIPLVDALEQMPRYVKFMKDVLSKKRGITEYETVKMTQESCQYLGRLPPKLQDPGSFTIPCIIGDTYQGKALCDLGASINLMPLSVFKQLSTGPVKPTTVTLQMADRSIVKPERKIKDLLVKVDKFILPVDFIILDYEADVDVPIILGRPFLATGGAVINVQKGELTMRVHDDEIKFNIVKAIKFQDEGEDLEECSALTLLDNLPSRKTEEEEYEEEEEDPQ